MGGTYESSQIHRWQSKHQATQAPNSHEPLRRSRLHPSSIPDDDEYDPVKQRLHTDELVPPARVESYPTAFTTKQHAIDANQRRSSMLLPDTRCMCQSLQHLSQWLSGSLMHWQQSDQRDTPKVVEYVPAKQAVQTDELEAPAVDCNQTQ